MRTIPITRMVMGKKKANTISLIHCIDAHIYWHAGSNPVLNEGIILWMKRLLSRVRQSRDTLQIC